MAFHCGLPFVLLARSTTYTRNEDKSRITFTFQGLAKAVVAGVADERDVAATRLAPLLRTVELRSELVVGALVLQRVDRQQDGTSLPGRPGDALLQVALPVDPRRGRPDRRSQKKENPRRGGGPITRRSTTRSTRRRRSPSRPRRTAAWTSSGGASTGVWRSPKSPGLNRRWSRRGGSVPWCGTALSPFLPLGTGRSFRTPETSFRSPETSFRSPETSFLTPETRFQTPETFPDFGNSFLGSLATGVGGTPKVAFLAYSL